MLPWLSIYFDSDVLTDITNCLVVSHVQSALSWITSVTWPYQLSWVWVVCGVWRTKTPNGEGQGLSTHPPTHPFFPPPLPQCHHNWASTVTPLGTKQPRWEGGRWEVGQGGWDGGGGGMEGKIDRKKVQVGRQSVEGWWISMTWSHNPERKETNKNRKHGLDRLY